MQEINNLINQTSCYQENVLKELERNLKTERITDLSEFEQKQGRLAHFKTNDGHKFFKFENGNVWVYNHIEQDLNCPEPPVDVKTNNEIELLKHEVKELERKQKELHQNLVDYVKDSNNIIKNHIQEWCTNVFNTMSEKINKNEKIPKLKVK